MHCIRLYNKIDLYLPSKKKIGSVKPRSVNDQITTLPFVGVQKYYDGSVALYIFIINIIWFVCVSAIPKLLFVKLRKKIIFFFFSNSFRIQLSPRCENKKVCDAELESPI